jgi:hypothetical protein
LSSLDAQFELPVWPVLLTWGPGAENTQLGPVDVVDGENPRPWVSAYQTGAVSSTLAQQVHAPSCSTRPGTTPTSNSWALDRVKLTNRQSHRFR